jgi:hypothetical protein
MAYGVARATGARRVVIGFTIGVVQLGLLNGCRNPLRSSREVVVEVSGHYGAGWEGAGFAPCDSARGWWVERTDSVPEFARFLGTLPPIKTPMGSYAPQVFVRWRGVRSRKGEYGHGGGSPDAFEPRQLLLVQAKTPNDCQQGVTKQSH